jgi:succinate dehydrogenase / fumarate reductase cytochrome b subunit
VLNLLLLRKLKDESVRDKPVYLNPFTFAFPITAVISFLHRVSGAILFFLIPIILSTMASVLYYPFDISSGCKITIWILLSAIVYHLLAGIRHLIMDCGYIENRNPARFTSYIVIVASILLSLLIGFRLC